MSVNRKNARTDPQLTLVRMLLWGLGAGTVATLVYVLAKDLDSSIGDVYGIASVPAGLGAWCAGAVTYSLVVVIEPRRRWWRPLLLACKGLLALLSLAIWVGTVWIIVSDRLWPGVLFAAACVLLEAGAAVLARRAGYQSALLGDGVWRLILRYRAPGLMVVLLVALLAYGPLFGLWWHGVSVFDAIILSLVYAAAVLALAVGGEATVSAFRARRT